jgi:hypothetical protein
MKNERKKSNIEGEKEERKKKRCRSIDVALPVNYSERGKRKVMTCIKPDNIFILISKPFVIYYTHRKKIIHKKKFL